MTVPYKDLFVALFKEKINYLVAGGFAVNFHHVNRATADLDLILHLLEDNICKFDSMMTDLGYVPRLPVTGKDFSKKENRALWVKEQKI